MVYINTQCACTLSHSVVSDSATPWTVARQAALSMGFSREEYCSGLSFPPAGVFATQGSLTSPASAGGFLTTSVTLEALNQPFTSTYTS